MNKRSAMVLAGALVVAMMGGMAGATHQALSLKAAAGTPKTVVVVQQPGATTAPAVPASQAWEED
jgi:hypothetical protein